MEVRSMKVRREENKLSARGPAIVFPCGSTSEHWLSIEEATRLRDELTEAIEAKTSADDKPSITELQRLHALYLDRRNMQAAANLIDAAPVLLEIAITGKVWAEAEDALARADSSAARVAAAMRATSAFDKHRAALAKVRP
jgi:hypothetical protein